jgi:hypothetical protein
MNEAYRPGQNVRVSSCKKSAPFCEVSAEILARGADDPRIPLKTPHCHCNRLPKEIKTIPDKIF